MKPIREALYTLGDGFKVAVEVILAATEKRKVKPYEDVIGVGGRVKGRMQP